MSTDQHKPGNPELRLEAEEFASLVDALQDYAIFLMTPEGQIRSWNRGAKRTMGYEADEAIGCNFRMFYLPEDAEKPQYELRVATETGRIEDEGWRVRKDGTRFWANTIITALRHKNGDVRAFAKVTRDMTQRREELERVRASEEMFRLLVSSVKDYAIFLLDPTGHIITWNAGAQRIKQYTPAEIIGQHFSIFYGEEDIRSGKPGRELAIATAEGSVEDEGWRLRKDGSRFWADVVITAVRDATGTLRGFAKVTRDVTERRDAEETRRALLEQRAARLQADEERRRAEMAYRSAQEANRAKDEFLMTLSHELRTPMTAILGWSRLLPSIAPNDPAFAQALTAISRGAQLQAALIDDVLDVSRIVSGKLRLSVEKVDVMQAINSAVDAVRASADAKSIAIRTAFAASLGTIAADPTRLQQVLWNMLTNAVKFTPKNGRIDLTAARREADLQIVVADNGEGIDPEFLPHMFEAFRQAENPSTRVHGGLGLGLSIVRYLVEAHGGTINAQSAGRGQGATFTVTLPISSSVISTPVENAPAQPENETAAVLADANRLQGIEILLVDDDADTRGLVATVLRRSGARVTVCDSARAALDFLAASRPDLMLTDIAMPEMDGVALTRAVREQPDLADLKIIAFSAFTAARGTAEEFAAYLTKPVEPAALVEAVAEVAAR